MKALINIDVPDLDAGIAFYEAGLGFTFRRRLFGRSVAEMRSGSLSVYLIEKAPGTNAVPNASAARDYGIHWTPVHLDLVVEDLESAMRRALGAGASPPLHVGDHAWGRIAPMRDPFGHGFCMIEFRDGGYDLAAD